MSQEARSRLMLRIKGKDTKPEKLIRAFLREAGLLGYRLHWAKAPGRPDICWPGRKVALFCHGCLWHDHECRGGKLPKSNIEFWKAKLERNKARDAENRVSLAEAGWEVVTVWECQLSTRPKREAALARLGFTLSLMLDKPLTYRKEA